MKRSKLLHALFLSVAPVLSACQTTSPGAIIAMASFDPLTVDPGTLGLQIVVPDGVGLRNGDLVLRLADDAPSGRLEGTFPLDIDREALAGAKARYRAELSAPQAEAMRRLQNDIRRSRSRTGLKGTGSFAVEMVAACTASGRLPSPMPVKAAIKVQSGQFIPAIDSADLPDDLNEVDRDALRSRIRACVN